MPKQINVNREHKNDQFYRYKMAEVEVKCENEGKNGQLTVLLNIETIASDLKKNIEILMTFFSAEFGCNSKKNKAGHYILNGNFSKEKIQDTVYDFIDTYVLCQKCKNPETYYILQGKNDVIMKCNACPETSLIPLNKKTMKVLKVITTKINQDEKNKK